MDPTTVLQALWRQRWFVLPAVLVSLAAAGYMFQYGPRVYESTVSYALVNPDVPSEAEMEENPELKEINSDNPYLRSSNPTLITDVMVTRLNNEATADDLDSRGLSPDYVVGRGGVGNGFVLDITGVGDSPEAARATKSALGDMMVKDLRVVQEVNGADPSYHFKALLIADSDKATERFSSRLRTVISVLLAGGLLVFAAVSLGEWITEVRRRGRHNDDGRDRAHTRTRTQPTAGDPGDVSSPESEDPATQPPVSVPDAPREPVGR